MERSRVHCAELLDWSEHNGVEPRHIQAGKPDQNTYIERYNRTFRQGVLNAYLFEDLGQVREISAAWLWTYNEKRPHEAQSTSTSELST